jgi:hypothetical protein
MERQGIIPLARGIETNGLAALKKNDDHHRRCGDFALIDTQGIAGEELVLRL